MRDIRFRALWKGKIYRVIEINWVNPQTVDLTDEITDWKNVPINEIKLMQYTELKDNNGNKIYEGDIVKCIDNINNIYFTAIVEFGNPNCEYSYGWQLKYVGSNEGDMPNMDILLWIEAEVSYVYTEVIGNIYENPEFYR